MIKHVEAHHGDDLKKMQQFKKKEGCDERSSLSEATDKFLLSLCTSNVPFNIVKNEYFRNFIHRLNPDYQLLTTDGIRRKLATTAIVGIKKAIQNSENSESNSSAVFSDKMGRIGSVGSSLFQSRATHQKEIVRVLKSETASRFDALLGNELATFALYCDPRFSYLPGILKNITWSNIENEVETYSGSIRVVTTDANGASHVAPPAPKKVKDDGSFFSRFFSSRRDVATTDSTRSEVVSYQSMIQSSRPPTSSDPLHFWALNAEKFPNLSVLANHSLASPSSAAPVERLFSQCGHMISSPRRNRLLPATLNNMILCAALADLAKGLRDDDDSEESSEENIDDEDDGNNNNSFNPANTASYSSAVQSVPPPIPINSFSSPPVLSASPQPLINSHSSPSSVPSASPISPISPPSPNNS
ncbi:Protein CBG20047 [Caenorhabditis briggsae]|uniref:Protein CBG20047 n=1 Tax=Caenorhabditis briggsae TaxID=6238 RepID=A8XWZ9_CAEBR|nr:Protein CBG20047 [Caenorhabditis briggsae]CAP37168.2 Protein CBG20047 [Caenorhabditis briggsae]